MKKHALVLPLLIALSFNTATAENAVEKPVPQKNHPEPMMVFKKTSPMPLLMGLIVKNAEALELNKKQNATFSEWRAKNMGSSLRIGNEILADEKAIKAASLAGKPNDDVEKILISMLNKRHQLATNMLQCRDLIIKTLDKKQWEKLVTFAQKKGKNKKKPL
ncbi:MAG: hypothetical protein KAU26_04220 [Methylococcales bacterium]|nr:hypothetical protein [Methylococcales bacterium]